MLQINFNHSKILTKNTSRKESINAEFRKKTKAEKN